MCVDDADVTTGRDGALWCWNCLCEMLGQVLLDFIWDVVEMYVGISFGISDGCLCNCRLGICLELRWGCCGHLEGMSVGMSVGNQWRISMGNFNGEVQWGIEWRSSVGNFNEDCSM